MTQYDLQYILYSCRRAPQVQEAYPPPPASQPRFPPEDNKKRYYDIVKKNLYVHKTLFSHILRKIICNYPLR